MDLGDLKEFSPRNAPRRRCTAEFQAEQEARERSLSNAGSGGRPPPATSPEFTHEVTPFGSQGLAGVSSRTPVAILRKQVSASRIRLCSCRKLMTVCVLRDGFNSLLAFSPTGLRGATAVSPPGVCLPGVGTHCPGVLAARSHFSLSLRHTRGQTPNSPSSACSACHWPQTDAVTSRRGLGPGTPACPRHNTCSPRGPDEGCHPLLALGQNNCHKCYQNYFETLSPSLGQAGHSEN